MTSILNVEEGVTNSVDLFFSIRSKEGFEGLRGFFLEKLRLDIGDSWDNPDQFLNVFVTERGLQVLQQPSLRELEGPVFFKDRATSGIHGVHAWTYMWVLPDKEEEIESLDRAAQGVQRGRKTFLIEVTDKGFIIIHLG